MTGRRELCKTSEYPAITYALSSISTAGTFADSRHIADAEARDLRLLMQLGVDDIREFRNCSDGPAALEKR
jgi:hypothetical protein